MAPVIWITICDLELTTREGRTVQSGLAFLLKSNYQAPLKLKKGSDTTWD
jgi:hypothetical protein